MSANGRNSSPFCKLSSQLVFILGTDWFAMCKEQKKKIYTLDFYTQLTFLYRSSSLIWIFQLGVIRIASTLSDLFSYLGIISPNSRWVKNFIATKMAIWEEKFYMSIYWIKIDTKKLYLSIIIENCNANIFVDDIDNLLSTYTYPSIITVGKNNLH